MKDNKQFLKDLKVKCKKGDLQAHYKLGLVYDCGLFGEKKNYKKAYKFYKLAANKGYVNAQYSLSVLYHFGRGVEKDTNKADKLLELVKQGIDKADFHLGSLIPNKS